MSLVIHYWIVDVQESQGGSASKMTYIVSGGGVKVYSLTHFSSRFESIWGHP